MIRTRDYQDRLDTLGHVRKAGMKTCCGGIVGMGETREQRAGLLQALANLPNIPSVPVNRLVQVEGTPLAGTALLDPFEFVRTIAAARIIMPYSMVHLSAGRAEMSDELQALCFPCRCQLDFLWREIADDRRSCSATRICSHYLGHPRHADRCAQSATNRTCRYRGTACSCCGRIHHRLSTHVSHADALSIARHPAAVSRPSLIARLAKACDMRAQDSLLRRMRSVDAVDGAHTIIDGRRLLDFASNDYLGLAQHPALIDALSQAAARWGVGASAAHLLGGHREEHSLLESELAAGRGASVSCSFSTAAWPTLV